MEAIVVGLGLIALTMYGDRWKFGVVEHWYFVHVFGPWPPWHGGIVQAFRWRLAASFNSVFDNFDDGLELFVLSVHVSQGSARMPQ